MSGGVTAAATAAAAAAAAAATAAAAETGVSDGTSFNPTSDVPSLAADAADAGSAEAVSPVTLSEQWSRVTRLLLLASLAVIGSVGNVFMISAVMIEDHLKKRGNAFLVNVALADLLVTGLLMPASAVVLLADARDNHGVCRFQWFLAVLCCLVSVLTLASVAVENYVRLCRPHHGAALTPARLTAALLAIWLLSGSAVALHFTLDLAPDHYCTSRLTGGLLLPYHAAVGALLVLLPLILTLSCYLLIAVHVRLAAARPSFKPPAAYTWDCALARTNLYSFILFITFWLPFGVIIGVGSVQPIPAQLLYRLSWFALSKSCVNNFLYCITNRHFRNAYVNLFHYCCCKTTVSFSRRQRGDATRPTGDVRVHIIPGYNMYSYTHHQSPQRSRETKCAAPKRPSGCSRPSTSGRPSREVYEL